ncbi:MAG: hypothetical protein HOH74_23685 [Gemmatimonadetes bacterium]|nr:hypothetical protein [Gemmatimonadota bacterium]
MSDEPKTGDPSAVQLTAEDHLVLDSVDGYHADGLALKKWWEEADADDGYTDTFEVVTTLNRPDSSLGFFGEAPLDRGNMPVMGVVDEVFYDRPKAAQPWSEAAASWTCDQIREFVLHYFMRISDCRQPEKVVVTDGGSPDSDEEVERQGMSFSQVYYKLKATGECGKFSPEDQGATMDLRQIGDTYDWIVVKLRVWDFTVAIQPMGAGGPKLTVPLKEESYLLLTPDFIVDEEKPEEGLLGEYGFGYAFIKNPTRGPFAYGPGEFETAYQQINFRVRENGESYVRMIFVSNRPDKIMNLSFDPVSWGFSLADLMSFGLASRFLQPVKSSLEGLSLKGGNMDPTLAAMGLLNVLTDGQAAERFDLSSDQLYKNFLVQHSRQHYQTIMGSHMTWRQIPDWLDSAALPHWVVSGMSA